MDDVRDPDLHRWRHGRSVPPKGGRRRGVVLIVAAVLLAALVAAVVGANAVVGRTRPADPCTTITVALSARGEPVTMAPDEVVVHERSSNPMSGFDATEVVASRSGYVVAIVDGFGPHGPTYRGGFVDAVTVDGLRACVEGPGFDDVVRGETSTNGLSSDGRFCSVTDASTTTISAGPAASGPKTLQAYALGTEDLCPKGRSAPVDGLFRALARIRTQVASTGAPVDAPPADLAPA